MILMLVIFIFQSTPSVRRATVADFIDTGILNAFQSTPSVRRATLWYAVGFAFCLISIHALREEGDNQTFPFSPPSYRFQSTPSVRRAT